MNNSSSDMVTLARKKAMNENKQNTMGDDKGKASLPNNSNYVF
jgi:hypothetical protein